MHIICNGKLSQLQAPSSFHDCVSSVVDSVLLVKTTQVLIIASLAFFAPKHVLSKNFHKIKAAFFLENIVYLCIKLMYAAKDKK